MLQTDNGCLGKTQTFHKAQAAAPLPHGKQPSGAPEQLEGQMLNWAQHEDPWLALELQICCRNREFAATQGFPIQGLCTAMKRRYHPSLKLLLPQARLQAT